MPLVTRAAGRGHHHRLRERDRVGGVRQANAVRMPLGCEEINAVQRGDDLASNQ